MSSTPNPFLFSTKEEMIGGIKRLQANTAEGQEEARAVGELAKLAEAASDATSDIIERAMTTVKETLGMDVVFVSRFTEDQMVFRTLKGDAESFGFEEGLDIPLENTFCKRMAEGQLTNIVQDAKNDERVNALDVTWSADIGSYMGMPLRFSDGRLYGTLCALSHSTDSSLRERDAQFTSVLARLVAEQLEREEAEAKTRRLEVRATGIRALLAALEARDGYTGEHSKAVVDLCVAVAKRMGLSHEEVIDVEQAALLHDIGKIGISDTILNKPGQLDEAEWEVIKTHTAIGERMLSSIEGLAHLAPIVRAEHERWDGKGYPDGLSGERIPLASRIVFACDAYHAMTSERPYRKAMSVRAALEELQKNSGTQFCPYTSRVLLGVLEQPVDGEALRA